MKMTKKELEILERICSSVYLYHAHCGNIGNKSAEEEINLINKIYKKAKKRKIKI